jgi:hypothetical protein
MVKQISYLYEYIRMLENHVKDLDIEGWNCVLEEVVYGTVYLMFSLNAKKKKL